MNSSQNNPKLTFESQPIGKLDFLLICMNKYKKMK